MNRMYSVPNDAFSPIPQPLQNVLRHSYQIVRAAPLANREGNLAWYHHCRTLADVLTQAGYSSAAALFLEQRKRFYGALVTGP